MLTAAIAAGSSVYAAGWLLTARAVYRRLLRAHDATWKRHAEQVRAGTHEPFHCTEEHCGWRYHLGPWPDERTLVPAAMGAALPWFVWLPGLGLIKAVTWQRPTPEPPAEAAARLERELQAEFEGKE